MIIQNSPGGTPQFCISRLKEFIYKDNYWYYTCAAVCIKDRESAEWPDENVECISEWLLDDAQRFGKSRTPGVPGVVAVDTDRVAAFELLVDCRSRR